MKNLIVVLVFISGCANLRLSRYSGKELNVSIRESPIMSTSYSKEMLPHLDSSYGALDIEKRVDIRNPLDNTIEIELKMCQETYSSGGWEYQTFTVPAHMQSSFIMQQPLKYEHVPTAIVNNIKIIL